MTLMQKPSCTRFRDRKLINIFPKNAETDVKNFMGFEHKAGEHGNSSEILWSNPASYAVNSSSRMVMEARTYGHNKLE